MYVDLEGVLLKIHNIRFQETKTDEFDDLEINGHELFIQNRTGARRR